VLKLNRSPYQYRLKLPSFKQQRLKTRIVALSIKHPRYGYRRIRALLDQEGWLVSRKLVQKVRRAEGLRVKSQLNYKSPEVFILENFNSNLSHKVA